MANEISSLKSHLHLITESTWGTTPGSPTRIHMPVEEYTVRQRNERRNARPFIGVRQRKHGKNYRGMPSGSLRAPLYGAVDSGGVSKAQYLLDWALSSIETLDRPSKSAEWAEGPDVSNKDHKGLRVAQATLSGSADTSFIELALEIMGKTEANLASAATIPTDHDLLQEMEFADATFALAGSAVEASSFQYVANHNMSAKYLNSRSPSHLISGGIDETFQISLVKNSDTYDAYRRAATATEITGQIVLRGLHNGTGASGTLTVITIDFARLSYIDHEDQIDFNSLTEIPLQFDVLKPDSSSNGITITYSEA